MSLKHRTQTMNIILVHTDAFASIHYFSHLNVTSSAPSTHSAGSANNSVPLFLSPAFRRTSPETSTLLSFRKTTIPAHDVEFSESYNSLVTSTVNTTGVSAGAFTRRFPNTSTCFPGATLTVTSGVNLQCFAFRDEQVTVKHERTVLSAKVDSPINGIRNRSQTRSGCNERHKCDRKLNTLHDCPSKTSKHAFLEVRAYTETLELLVKECAKADTYTCVYVATVTVCSEVVRSERRHEERARYAWGRCDMKGSSDPKRQLIHVHVNASFEPANVLNNTQRDK